MAKTKKNNYIDNQQLHLDIIEYIELVKHNKKNKLPKPTVPDSIAAGIMAIAQHLSYRPNFVNYAYREDMVSDAIINGLQCLGNYNPTLGKPFSYFTMVMWRAFVRNIKKEKSQLYTKYVCIENTLLSTAGLDKYGDEFSDDYMREFMSSFENTQKEKKKKKATKVVRESKNMNEFVS